MTTVGLYQKSCSSPESAISGRRLILSVDDDLSVLDSRFRLLSAAGYAVLSTTDGANALQLFGMYPIDLVVLDYMMPEIDGALIAHAMKDYEPDVPIIMISGLDLADQKMNSVNRLLMKGKEPEAMLGAVQELLASSVRIRSRAGS